MIRRDVLTRVLPDLSEQGFKILLDVITAANPRPRVEEVPFRFRARERCGGLCGFARNGGLRDIVQRCGESQRGRRLLWDGCVEGRLSGVYFQHPVHSTRSELPLPWYAGSGAMGGRRVLDIVVRGAVLRTGCDGLLFGPAQSLFMVLASGAMHRHVDDSAGYSAMGQAVFS